MADRSFIERARKDASQGKSPSTQAGDFVREEFHHLHEGKHGAHSPQQAVAIGLSKARRAGVELPAPPPGKTSHKVRRQAERDLERGHGGNFQIPKTSRTVPGALQHEGHPAAADASISKRAKGRAHSRGSRERLAAARKAVRTHQPLRST